MKYDGLPLELARSEEKDTWVMGREWPWQVNGTILVVSDYRQSVVCSWSIYGRGESAPDAIFVSSCLVKAKLAMANCNAF